MAITTDQHIIAALQATEGLYAHLKALEGDERREGIRKALDAGYGPSELARGLGVSRSRIYQLAR